MNWYSIYKNEWKEIIETVASEEKRSNTIVEKIRYNKIEKKVEFYQKRGNINCNLMINSI